MGQFEDLTGKRFHELTVLGRADVDRPQERWWICKCDCGGLRNVSTEKLNNGRIKRCTAHRGSTYGDHGKKLYNTWKRINQRCTNPNVERFAHYGGRGITNKFKSYREFREWSLANGFDEGLSIDRIDNDGHYEPANCRWTNDTTQMRNTTRNTVNVTDVANIKRDRSNGESYQNLANKFGVSKGCIAHIVKGRSWADISPAY